MTGEVGNIIEGLERDLAAERRAIAEAIASKAVGNGYWQKAHEIERRLKIARAMREAIVEGVS